VIRNEFLKEYPTNIIQYEQQHDDVFASQRSAEHSANNPKAS